MNIKTKMSEIQKQYEELKDSIIKEEAIIENAKGNIASLTREIYITQGRYQMLEELDTDTEKCVSKDSQTP